MNGPMEQQSTRSQHLLKAHPPVWLTEMRDSFRSEVELLNFLDIDPKKWRPKENLNTLSFPVLVPKVFANRIEKGNVSDPILAQVLPRSNVRNSTDLNFVKDPLSESLFRKSDRVVHKYKGRILVVVHGHCAVHCRYCFRQNFPYASSVETRKHVDEVVEYLNEHEDVNEVIFSGGDPLSLNSNTLRTWIEGAVSVKHVRTLRFHTRFPIVIPSRIDDVFLNLMSDIPLPVTIVLHTNHANELKSEDLKVRLKRLNEVSNVKVLNQSVLLKGVNDTYEALSELSWRLNDLGVLPYYLHQLDHVQGAEGFYVDRTQGIQLIEQMRQRLPGYMIPKYVVEEPGEASKTPIR